MNQKNKGQLKRNKWVFQDNSSKVVIKENIHQTVPINKNESHKTKNPNMVENEIEPISRILFYFMIHNPKLKQLLELYTAFSAAFQTLRIPLFRRIENALVYIVVAIHDGRNTPRWKTPVDLHFDGRTLKQISSIIKVNSIKLIPLNEILLCHILCICKTQTHAEYHNAIRVLTQEKLKHVLGTKNKPNSGLLKSSLTNRILNKKK
ncbi:hypothetical protein AGLY_015406 [Aphis glycines]|uniref:Uncharacterized protein n=1 Tax=Aphis glycines TaxID=307491 RepID=A0A6G0T2L4_APHGL|nr:hypothetical protein AGLY_015406 [Aphis glycines]